MAPSDPPSEVALIGAVLAGKPAAAERFGEIAYGAVWSVVIRLEGPGPAGEAAFRRVFASLGANGYERLRAFDGRARLATYIELVARDILAQQLARAFVEMAREEAWARFERFFADDIRRKVRHRFPHQGPVATHEDIYQEVCLRLVEDDFHRIRSYRGQGSFTGFVLKTVGNILIDLLRHDAPRRRLPAAVARLEELDQAIYTAIAWDGCPPDLAQLAPVLHSRLGHTPEPDAIRLALQRISPLLPVGEARPNIVSIDTAVTAATVADAAPNPEEELVRTEEESFRAKVMAAVSAAAEGLPPEKRLYLQTVLSTSDDLPPRQIAKRLGCEVETVYDLKQWAQRWLKEIAAGLRKKQSLSV